MGGLIIAGDRSSSGKTTVTMALLSALRQRGDTVQAFKVGPDYIDPMFHRAITGRPAYNLDPVLTSESYVQSCFETHGTTATYAIVEGVMGLFDGAGGTDWASTAHIARLLTCPVLLVVDCARLSRSLAAIVHGYQTLDPQVQIAGVVLNRVGSDRHLAMLKGAIAPFNIPILGVLRRDDAVTLPDRHLGLVPTDELPDLPHRFRYLATLGNRCFDWQGLEKIFHEPGASASPLIQPATTPESLKSDASAGVTRPLPIPNPLRIGVARDRAFNFYYEDNLALLTHLGAEVVPFSPLADISLPPNLHGLLLGGGFPEMFAHDLSDNATMRQSIAAALAIGMPTYAECGGLMYLCEALVDLEGRSRPMVGAIAATTTMTPKLTLGYRQVTALRDSLLVASGQQYWGHEFHRSVIAPPPQPPLSSLKTYPLLHEASLSAGTDGWGDQALHAAYVHVHWGTQPALARRFLTACDRFQQHQRSSSAPRS